jgi:uncharacterized RDD family membrane protein YckC
MDTELYPASLFRRLAAALYDSLILIALFMLFGVLALTVTGGEAVEPGNPWYRSGLLAVAMLFFCSFWIRAGQTLGMRAWRLVLRRQDGGPLRLRDAALRFFCALVAWGAAGLGVLWMLVDSQGLTWQDRWSGTRVWVQRPPVSGSG